MSLVYGALSPHPPLLVPAIGKDNLQQVTSTRQALQQLAASLVDRKPHTVVFITPHGPVRGDAVSMLTAADFQASFKSFEWTCSLQGNLDLANAISEEARKSGFPTYRYASFDSSRYYFSRGLDHATMVPLYYFREAGLTSRAIVLSIAAWSHRDHYEFGKALSRAVEAYPESVAVVASGDLSHRLIPTAPAGYEPQGIEFDRRIVRNLEAMDTDNVLALEDDLIERIGECGLRPLSTLLGTLCGRGVTSRVLSYEGPFGVGYCVAELLPTAEPSPSQREDAELYLGLVKETVESYVRSQQMPTLPQPLPQALTQKRAAFVCLKKNQSLRGCIGTTHSTQANLAHELMHNAVSACSRDPRFPPVTEHELPHLQYSVDVLEEPEAVSSVDELDPKIFGVIVRSGTKSGVLLPDLEGVENARAQVDIARQKAGIGASDSYDLLRFKVRRFRQPGAKD